MATLAQKRLTGKKPENKQKKSPGGSLPRAKATRARRERVLVEFPVSLLERTDSAAMKLEKNRSELIRTAVEKLLEEIERTKFESELAAAYAANARMNLDIVKDFANVDREGF